LPDVRLPAALILVLATTAVAEEVPDFDSDYAALTEELPIDAGPDGAATTFVNPGGGVATFYGQANLAYQSFADGDATTTGIVDNGNWNTRLGVTITQPLGSNTLRFRFETGLGLRSSAAVSQVFDLPVIDWQRTSLRWFEVALDTGYGTLSLGQGSMASDGTAGLDDSFTFVAGATNSADGFGAFRFRDADGELTDVTIGQVNAGFGGNRRFRLRFDTPVVSGVMFSASYGQNVLATDDDTDYSDIAIRWTGDVGDVAIRSAAGYQWLDNPAGDSRRVAASVAAIHGPTGLNLAVSTGTQIDGARYVWTRLGWRTDPFAIGTTSLSTDYYIGHDFLSDGARTENFGIYAVQTIDSASIDLYAGWRRFTYSDRLGGSYQDADGVLLGARWSF
jgi:hypothetical protein